MSASIDPAPRGDLATALSHARALLRRDPGLAQEQALEILKVYPYEIEAREVLATALRRQGSIHEALRVLEPAMAQISGPAATLYEFGLCLVAAGRRADALTALRRAVAADETHAEAWRALGDVLAAAGDRKGSQNAYKHYLLNSVRHPELILAAGYLYDRKLPEAEHLCRELLKKCPDDVAAIRMLAEIGMRLGQYRDAELLLQRCLELAPEFDFARANYAFVLFRRQKFEPALAQLETLLAAEPHNPNHLLLKAAVLVRMGRFEQAIEVYEHVLGHYPGQPKAQLSYGHALKTVGRQSDAIDAYRACIGAAPSMGEAYWSLANLKTYSFADSDIAAMRRWVASDKASEQDRVHLCFALGKALEDREDYDGAFGYYRQGNETRRKHVRYSPEENRENTDRLIEVFDADFAASRGEAGCPAADPIFIVGLPRSGSTLLEQILASHSQVEGTMELPDIIAIARRLSGKKKPQDVSRYPEVLRDLGAEDRARLGEEYLRRTRVQRHGAPFFIDKMPNNFSHIGLIHLILPNARIIDARRHPLGTCFSCYKQLFARGQNFTYSLEDLGGYYRDYARLMDHWDMVLPGRVLRVCYEDMVSDPEAEVRRLLDFCGLPFEEACLRFYETDRAVRTASSEQVRRPLYTSALHHWRHFDKHLDALRTALGPALAGAETAVRPPAVAAQAAQRVGAGAGAD